MEIQCPHCSQRLRYPDHLKNPLLRCRNCTTTFRPWSASRVEEPVAAEAVEEYPVRADEAELQEFLAETSPSKAPQAGSASGKTGIGYLALVLFLIAFKVGPHVAREFFRGPKRERPVQMRREPPPVDARQRDVERRMQEAIKKAENAAARRNHPVVPLPDGNVPLIP